MSALRGSRAVLRLLTSQLIDAGRIDRANRALALEPRPRGFKKLAGKQFENLYRIRVGDWRILYAIEDDRLVVLVLDVVYREKAYRSP